MPFGAKRPRNAYIACQEAIRQGVQYLLLDKVTVDQDQGDDEMLVERLSFSKLYQELPVIAAYDDASPQHAGLTAEVHGTQVALGHPFVRTIRRPWIVHEVLLYRSNPTRVTYVGQTMNGVRSQLFTDCILDVVK